MHLKSAKSGLTKPLCLRSWRYSRGPPLAALTSIAGFLMAASAGNVKANLKIRRMTNWLGLFLFLNEQLALTACTTAIFSASSTLFYFCGLTLSSINLRGG
jgi:hypothetical protein